MSFQTTVSSGTAFNRDFYVFTDKRPYWEINNGRVDIFVGDMEAVHTQREGTWTAITVVEVSDEEELELPQLNLSELAFDEYFAMGQLAHENARGILIHHIPTDIAVRVGSESSQIANKAKALAILTGVVAATESEDD
jgi:hypothetical protein